MVFWKAKLLEACVAKGTQSFFTEIQQEGGIERFLASFEFPEWFSECPKSLEIRELFQNLSGVHKQGKYSSSLFSPFASTYTRYCFRR
jgi:hypothetical protein